jgi:uridine phosphorylase
VAKIGGSDEWKIENYYCPAFRILQGQNFPAEKLQKMNRIEESELILNARGALYHVDLRPEELADTIITVGDPDRVPVVSKFFDKIEFKRQHREFVTHTGFIGSKRLTVISTGIGPDNIDIVLNELDAVVNIDLGSRTIKKEHTTLNFIRMGTCGSLQAEIEVDQLVAGTHGIGLDNLLWFYRLEPGNEEIQILQQFITQTQLNSETVHPYISSASVSLLKNFVDGYQHGITVTCPGFYGPQGRILRLGLRQPNLIDHLTKFSLGSHRIANFEMETSAIYGLSRLLGHHCLSLNTVVANRVTKTFSKDGEAAVNNLVSKSLEILSSL